MKHLLNKFGWPIINTSFCLVILFSFHSCKKESITGPVEKPVPTKDVKIETVSFAYFQNSVNRKSLAKLSALLSVSTKTQSQINVKEVGNTGQLIVNTDSVKKITANGHTSYVFSIKLATPRAITF